MLADGQIRILGQIQSFTVAKTRPQLKLIGKIAPIPTENEETVLPSRAPQECTKSSIREKIRIIRMV